MFFGWCASNRRKSHTHTQCHANFWIAFWSSNSKGMGFCVYFGLLHSTISALQKYFWRATQSHERSIFFCNVNQTIRRRVGGGDSELWFCESNGNWLIYRAHLARLFTTESVAIANLIRTLGNLDCCRHICDAPFKLKLKILKCTMLCCLVMVYIQGSRSRILARRKELEVYCGSPLGNDLKFCIWVAFCIPYLKDCQTCFTQACSSISLPGRHRL